MKIRVGFSTTNSLISRTIRWFIEDNVSHTYLRFHDEFLGADLIMHADWPGVIIEDAALFDKQNIVVEEFEIEDPRVKQALKRNLRLLRRKYDYWNILGWAWVITFKRWAHKKMLNPIDDPKKIICVDFIRYFLDDMYEVPKESLNPKTLRKWMYSVYEQHGWKKDTKVE